MESYPLKKYFAILSLGVSLRNVCFLLVSVGRSSDFAA